MAYVNVPGAMWYCLGGVVEGVRARFVTYALMAMVALVMGICSLCVLYFAVLLLTTTLDSVKVVCVICRFALGICRRTTYFATCSCTGSALQEAWITCCALFLESPGDCSGVVAYVHVPGAMWYCLGGVVECARAWFVTYAHMAMVALVMAICSLCVLYFAVLLLTTTLDRVRVVCVICRCALGICRRTTYFATCSCTGRALQEAWITCCALFLESPGDCSGICEYSRCHVVLFRWCCWGC